MKKLAMIGAFGVLAAAPVALADEVDCSSMKKFDRSKTTYSWHETGYDDNGFAYRCDASGGGDKCGAPPPNGIFWTRLGKCRSGTNH